MNAAAVAASIAPDCGGQQLENRADMDVGFIPENGHTWCQHRCPLSAGSEHAEV
jgi:hypothetical protein